MSDITVIGESLIEPCPIMDIYADGIGDLELIGDGHNVRLVYYTLVRGEPVIVAKLVMPLAVVGEHVRERLAEKRRHEGIPTVQ